MRKIRRRDRRGMLILVVLGLLVLFVMVAVAFVIAASQHRLAARAASRAKLAGTPAKKQLDQAVRQLLRGTTNTNSALYGHDLLRDIYGNDGVTGTISNVLAPTATAGGQMVKFAIDTSAATTPNYYAGCVITFTSGLAKDLSARIVKFNYTNNTVYALMPQSDAGPILPSVGDGYLINGRPFNGTGAGYNYYGTTGSDGTGKLDAKDNLGSQPLALLPNYGWIQREQSIPLYPLTPAGQPASKSILYGGSDESYDAPDYQNMFLAYMPSVVTSSNQILPSFHRQDLIKYWQTNGTFNANLKRRVLLRPTAADNPNFPTINLLTGPWDVDNDGDGVTDSIWVDVDFPIQKTLDGQRYKPLVAYLCLDLDGRLNANAHGSPGHLNPPVAVNVAGGTSAALPRGMGFGPADINLQYLLGSNYSKLFVGNGLWPGRYGTDGVPGAAFGTITAGQTDPLAQIKFFEHPLTRNETYFGSSTGSRTSFGSPGDLWGRAAYGVNARGAPVFEGQGSQTHENPYELNLSHNIIGRGASAVGRDAPYSLAELEHLLRPYDVDASGLPQRLWQLVGGLGNSKARRLLTTSSRDVPMPNVLPTRMLNDAGGTNNYYTNRHNRPQHVAELLRARLVNTLTNTQKNQLIQEYLPVEMLRGLRMNVNRPFGNGRDDNGNYVVDDFNEAGETLWGGTPAGPVTFDYDNDVPGIGSVPLGLRTRYAYARSLYVLMMMLTDPGYGSNYPTNPADATAAGYKQQLHARRLAQWAINAVDFRDADAIMTPFEYDLNPFNGWQPDGDPNSPVSSEGGDARLVWGAEYPELLLTETLAFHDTRIIDSASDNGPKKKTTDDTDGDGNPDDPNFDQYRIPQGSFFAELYCTRGTTARNANAVFPRELYSYNSGNWYLDLGRMAPNNKYPVWRLAIYRPQTSGKTAQGYLNQYPATTTLQPNVAGSLAPGQSQPFNLFQNTQLTLDRIVWFSTTSPQTAGVPNQNRIFYNRTGAPVTVAPGRYAVVGPRPTTYIGSTTATPPAPASQRIQLSPNAAAYNTGGNTNPNFPAVPAVGVICSMPAPSGWTTAPNGIGVNISEPLPTGVNYYSPEPTTQIPGYTRQDAYGIKGMGNSMRDTPFDLASTTPLGAAGIKGTGTKQNFRSVFLQRLANPLAPYNAKTNPYITVDWSPVDLTVFNGEAPQNPPAPTNLGATSFATRERGSAGGGTTNIWRAQTKPPVATGAVGMNNAYFAHNLVNSLGFLNSTYGAPKANGDPTTPFPWLVWNNRPFVNQYELMQVPTSSPQRLLTEHTTAAAVGGINLYQSGGDTATPYQRYHAPFGHLLNFFLGSNSGNPGPHYYRLFEYTHVPSRFVGTEMVLNPSIFASNSDAAGMRPPFNRLSKYREPGRVNLNTMTDPIVWNAILNGHGGGTPTFAQIVQSRRGYATGTGPLQLNGTYPSVFSNPFRSFGAGPLAPLPSLQQTDVQCTIMRLNPNTTRPLLEYTSTANYNHTGRNPFFRWDALQHIGNLVTTRSNVYAVWVTIGYFKVEPDGAGGFRLAQELGSTTGEIERHRAFYIIDRSIPVGYQPGVDHNTDDAILLHTFIE